MLLFRRQRAFHLCGCLKKAWGLIKFEEELDWHTYCRIKYNRNDLNEDDPFVLDCAEGDDPASWVQNEIDCWADYSRAFEKKDIKYLISFYWGVRLSL
jgi:hypothetical protein